ncbi:DUF6686 family protein [Chitinophagaceae bacterium LWZ2-11]
MCDFKSWYFDDKGYIIQCMDCKNFQVCFGTTMLTLSEHNYQAFADLVFYKKETHVPMNNDTAKCVILATPCKTIHSILTEPELTELYNMLQDADTEMKAEQLIQLFKV